MERRKILLGSGAALTTALAGCTGSGGNDDDDPDDDDKTESITDDDSENENSENEETENEESENGNESDSEESDGTGETSDADIPGFDGSKLSLESDAVSITSVERANRTVEVVATSEVTDLQKLYAELETLADAHENAIVDVEAFADAIDAVDWVVDHDAKKVISFSVKTDWLADYRNGDLSANAFLENVKTTAE
ncbi:hypothetical protein Htur_3172 [Haloterrigena turkmenica DSM 5511]|uniref:DUF8159 domain-containing protein n=1 Tax=Haloterrigena turkmenica (strain ATCC 51198 / DSM 5511 / JCM 9101 / NCIMB 13204 / VKM B-1734 / 4k) TaxID=543526 RepID=D2RZJ8_HALTV|nr:hypothetical protein [Haloterrigena turkmenica]ADB62037.1 hypothetical protein Htur_3172 [Haloterrigena turkmenica DSM 5511]